MTTEIQEYSQTEAALSMLREKYTNVSYDVDTADGMIAAKSGRSEVRSYRTSLEKMRKEIKAPALERCRLIDTEAKRITAELVFLENPIDQQIKEIEAKKEAERQAKIDAELKRVEDIQKRLDEIHTAPDSVGIDMSATEIEGIIESIERILVDDSFSEFQQRAEDTKIATLTRLRDLYQSTKTREQEQLELRQLREENEKRNVEQAEREAEARKKREAAEKKQREELEAQRKKQAAVQAEIDAENKRIAEERAKFEAQVADAKRKEEAKAEIERKRKEKAQAAAKKAKYPGERAIVEALAEHFDVLPEVVRTWLTEIKKAA